MKVIFFGSSSFSIPVLAKLLDSKHEVVLVITTPDQKKGRGQKVAPSVVKAFAEEKELRTLAPPRLSKSEAPETALSLKPDFLAVASYGKMVPASIFNAPKLVALNVHPSLLPRHRGASPIQAAILSGDKETGVSIAEVTAKLDAGDVFGQARTEIGCDENAQDLSDRLGVTAADLLLEVMDQFEDKSFKRTPQIEAQSTYAKKIEKKLGVIDWSHAADELHRHIRAYYPWPSALTFLNGKRLKVLHATLVDNSTKGREPGEILKLDKDSGIHVQAGCGIVGLKRVQMEGRREMDAYDLAMGQRLEVGERLGPK